MSNLYTEKDFADVVDESGEVVGRAPKAWAGTDLLPAGQKVKGGRRASSTSDEQKPPADTGSDGKPSVPAESENRDVLEAFAVEHAGISEEDAKAFNNKGDLHAAIITATTPGE